MALMLYSETLLVKAYLHLLKLPCHFNCGSNYTPDKWISVPCTEALNKELNTDRQLISPCIIEFATIAWEANYTISSITCYLCMGHY